MRRIYESDAVRRDPNDPFSPGEGRDEGRTNRAINWDAASHAFVPMRLRYCAIDVTIEPDRTRYEPDEDVLFTVTMRNRAPIPITITTRTPRVWTWAVDGVDRASRVVEFEPPDRSSALRFARSERKVFEKRWSGSIRETEREWEPVEPGRHELSAWIDVADPEAAKLIDAVTIEIER